MDLDGYFEDAEGKNCLEKWKNSTDCDDNPSGGFDCNICLDTVQDPVVTLCGHLYCWPCIYKWLHFQTMSTENPDQKQQQCPVCKADVSLATLIPLYGRDLTPRGNKTPYPQFGIAIPKRPPAPCDVSTITSPNGNITNTNRVQFPQHYSYDEPQIYYPQQGVYPAEQMLSPDGIGMTINVVDPVTRMVGEMLYTRVFGNSTTNLYTYPNSYNLAGTTSRRIRRHVMQADESLSRISFFLLCCVVLCLVLF